MVHCPLPSTFRSLVLPASPPDSQFLFFPKLDMWLGCDWGGMMNIRGSAWWAADFGWLQKDGGSEHHNT